MSSISLQQEISVMVKQKCLFKVLLHRNSDIFYSLQQEISAMVQQKFLYKILLHRNSDIFYFSATRNQCNGETEMFCFEDVLLHWNSDIFYSSAIRNQCNGETEISSYKFYFIGSLISFFLCNKKSVQW